MPHPVYFYLALLLVVLWLIGRDLDSKYRNWAFVVSGLALAAVLSLRHAEFGNIDMSRYKRYYWNLLYENNIFRAMSSHDGNDQVFWLITWLFSRNRVSYQNYVTIISLFSVCIYLYYIWR